MSSQHNKYDPLTGDLRTVFFRYSIPEIVGMLAMSSAAFVDSIFLGNFVGSDALASINLSVPVYSIIFGLGLLISVGGSVVSGKFIGEGQRRQANMVFTKTLIAGTGLGFIALIFGLGFLDFWVAGLGAQDEVLRPLLTQYLYILFWFVPFMLVELVLYYFVRLDGHPNLSSAALVIGGIVNVLMDWLLIIELEMGIAGAAYATASGAVVGTFVLIPHFFMKRAGFKLTGPLNVLEEWKALIRAFANGLSEFANETSIGVMAFIFNWVMITRMGVEGVAALTIVDHLVMAGLIVGFGVSDSLQPTISQNFGAKQPERILKLLQIAAVSIGVLSSLMIMAMVVFPEFLVGIFLKEGEDETMSIAVEFMFYLWPAFLFNGFNILLSAYLTSMQKPLESTFIAFSRGLTMPALFLLLLPIWFGDVGIYLAMPLAEGVTFLLALFFLKQNMPDVLVKKA